MQNILQKSSWISSIFFREREKKKKKNRRERGKKKPQFFHLNFFFLVEEHSTNELITKQNQLPNENRENSAHQPKVNRPSFVFTFLVFLKPDIKRKNDISKAKESTNPTQLFWGGNFHFGQSVPKLEGFFFSEPRFWEQKTKKKKKREAVFFSGSKDCFFKANRPTNRHAESTLFFFFSPLAPALLFSPHTTTPFFFLPTFKFFSQSSLHIFTSWLSGVHRFSRFSSTLPLLFLLVLCIINTPNSLIRGVLPSSSGFFFVSSFGSPSSSMTI